MSPVPAAPPVDTADLHALADGCLEPGRRAAVLAHLAASPDDARRVAHWAEQADALRQTLLAAPLEPPSQGLGEQIAQLRQVRTTGTGRSGRRRAGWPQAAALLLACGLGWSLGLASTGWRLPASGPDASASAARGLSAPEFVSDAKAAHTAFAPEKRHPVEVAANDHAHLVQWLSRRLGVSLRTPDLAPQGWQLLGGRLLPGDHGPRAQFMYEDNDGRRLTLYVTVFEPGDAVPAAAFRKLRTGGIESFYWIEGRQGFALSGEVPAPELEQLARSVHRQLQP